MTNKQKMKINRIEIKGTPEQQQRVMREFNRSIFRPVQGDGKILTWIKKKVIKWIQKNDVNQKRFTRIHRKVKTKIIHPFLKFVAKKFGKYLLKDSSDIPKHWFNNHLRMFHWSFEQGLDDMWIYMYYQAHGKITKQRLKDNGYSENPGEEEFLKYCHDFCKVSHVGRLKIMRIWMSYVLEDTIDREWLNMSIMRLTHEMMKYYGVSEIERNKVPVPGQFPVYLTNVSNNPDYFIRNMNVPVWKEPMGKDKIIRKVNRHDNRNNEKG